MVCLSMEDLKFASELADLIGSGREFHKRMVLGKKEWRCVSILERGTKKLSLRRGAVRGFKSSRGVWMWLCMVLYSMVTLCLALLSWRGGQPKEFIFLLDSPC